MVFTYLSLLFLLFEPLHVFLVDTAQQQTYVVAGLALIEQFAEHLQRVRSDAGIFAGLRHLPAAETRHRDRICGKDTKDDIRQREALSRC